MIQSHLPALLHTLLLTFGLDLTFSLLRKNKIFLLVRSQQAPKFRKNKHTNPSLLE